MTGVPPASDWNRRESAHRVTHQREEAGMLLYLCLNMTSHNPLKTFWSFYFLSSSFRPKSETLRRRRYEEAPPPLPPPNVNMILWAFYSVHVFYWSSKFTHLSCTILTLGADSSALCFSIYCFSFVTHHITFQGKYQVSAELKDKEINNLKEELRSLQVLRCTTLTDSSLWLCVIQCSDFYTTWFLQWNVLCAGNSHVSALTDKSLIKLTLII